MKIWRFLTARLLRDTMQELKEVMEENVSLRQQAMWITKAQERSINPKRRVADYQETAPKAVELLREAAFNTAYSDLIVEIQQKTFNSSPDQVELREKLYMESQLLQKILLKLDYQRKVATTNQLKSA